MRNYTILIEWDRFKKVYMIYLNDKFFKEVNDKRYEFHPYYYIISRERDPPKSLPFQYQKQSITNIRKNPKVIKNQNDETEFEI